VEFEVALQARCTPRRDDAARAVEPSAGVAARLEHAVFGQLDDLLDRQPRCLAELVEFDISLVVEKMQSGGRHAAPPRSPRGLKFDSSRSRSYSAFSSSDSVAGVTICSTQYRSPAPPPGLGRPLPPRRSFCPPRAPGRTRTRARPSNVGTSTSAPSAASQGATGTST